MSSIKLVEFSGSSSWSGLSRGKRCGTLEQRSLACVGGRPVSKSQHILR